MTYTTQYRPSKTIAERYAEATPEPFTGVGLMFLDDADKYFSDMEEVELYCEDNEIKPSDLQLFHTKPVFATPLDRDSLIDRWEDYLPDSDDEYIPQEILDAFEAFNDAIKACKTPLSWSPDYSRRVLIPGERDASCR